MCLNCSLDAGVVHLLWTKSMKQALLMKMEEQEESTFQDSGPVVSTHMPLAKVIYMDKLNINGLEEGNSSHIRVLLNIILEQKSKHTIMFGQ